MSTDPSHEEQLAAMRAETDQAREATREVATLMWAYFSALQSAGFNMAQALTLTVGYQGALLANNKPPP